MKIKKMTIKNLIKAARYVWFYYFRRKEMIRRYKEFTKGKKCKGCGCCKTAILGCRWFDKNTNRCKLWGTNKMPLICKLTPFDDKYMNEFQRENCAFANKPKAKKSKIREVFSCGII